MGSVKEFLRNRTRSSRPVGYLWDHLDRTWHLIRDPGREVFPGAVVLLAAASGGYSPELGWSPTSTEPVSEHPEKVFPSEATEDDPGAWGPTVTIADHTERVCRKLAEILESLGALPDRWAVFLAKAARWHDVGKAHGAFQWGLRRAIAVASGKSDGAYNNFQRWLQENGDPGQEELWAKSGTSSRLKYGRRYFRHELASALASLQSGVPFEAAYLIAAHHGRVRLSIRALPEEAQPGDPKALFALGIHSGDRLPAVKLGDDFCPSLELDLSPMLLGGDESWTARALALRDADTLGPFRLAYLEAILRAADRRASKEEREGVGL